MLGSACSRTAPAPAAGAGKDPGKAAGSGAAAQPAADLALLVRGNGPEPDSLDPQRARNVESANVLRDMYEALTSIGHDGAPVPGAASSWSQGKDGLRWTFKLRPTARWSNGEPVVAADFVAGLRRLVDPATASQYAQVVDVIRNAPAIIAGKLPPSELGVSAPDALTVVIDLATQAPYLPGLMSHWSTMPIHSPSLLKYGSEFTKPGNHVSNGAFRLARWVQGAYIELERNPQYWNDASTRIGRVRWLSQSDENAEYKRYRSGEIQVTYTVPRAQFDDVRRDHAKELHLGPQLGTYFLGVSLDREPLGSRPALRRALSLVIDRERIVKSITRVGELPAYGWVPPGVFEYGSQSFDYAKKSMSARIAEAQQLYGEAGFSAARPLRFELRYNTGEVHARIAVAVAAMWKEALGAEVKLRATEFKVLQQEVDAREVDVFRSAWIGDYNDAYTFAQYFKSDFGINTPRFTKPRYDALLAAAAQEPDSKHRRSLLEEAERVLLADHPVIPIYFYVNKHLVSPKVSGWYDNVMNVVYSRDLALTP
jgi:oligopeptide transport system substrate-binding protein